MNQRLGLLDLAETLDQPAVVGQIDAVRVGIK